MRQRRAYGDDSLSITPEQYLFTPYGLQNEEKEDKGPVRPVTFSKNPYRRKPGAWGLSVEDSGVEPPNAQDVSEQQDDLDEQDQDSLWQQFEKTESDKAQQSEYHPFTYQTDLDASQTPSLLDIDYASALPTALLDNEPDLVARCLFAAARKDDLDFIRSIPPNTFAECIRILQPSNMIARLTSAHIEISEAMTKQLGLMSIQQVAWEHSQLLQEVLAMRRAAGIQIGLSEYRTLLKSAADLGQNPLAIRLWSGLLEDRCAPDTACYNYMMASAVWNGVHSAAARHKIRVIPLYQLARTQARLGPGFANYRLGTDGGIKSQVMKIFGDMLKYGAVADEESYRNVITAAAREGDVATVISVLRKVWDIDVDALMAGTAESSMTLKSFDKTSPLRPTSKLLFTIAHAFCINNDMPTALRVVDFVARQYDIGITLEVWDQLFEWTFALATPRTGVKARTVGTRTGQLPKQSVLSLWQTMTGPPYFVQPTMGMYNHLIKNLQQRSWTPALYEKMREGLELHWQSRARAYKALKRLKRKVAPQDQNESTLPRPATALETLRREWEHADLLRKRSRFWCQRWLRLLLGTLRDFSRVDKEMNWPTREIPRILWEWRVFAPRVVRYETLSGMVEIEFRTEEEIEQHRERRERRMEETREVLEKAPLFVGEEWAKSRRGRRRVRDEDRLEQYGSEQVGRNDREIA